MLTLAQTLHGYDQGHRLLASGGDLDARELSLLDRLSDLSGYLPTGTHFDRYHTGFPCGRYYALACTWSDGAATRAGTVLTHTLLLPRNEARALEDPWGLTLLHRRPAGAADRDAYRETLSLPELPTAARDFPRPDDAAAAGVLLFGTQERPILWVEERPADAIVRFLWSLLRGEQREHFAFCTFALQPRTVEGRAFDFLGLPPTARGSFLEMASSEAWWDSGRLLHPRLASLTQKDWAMRLAREGAATLRRLEAVCHAQGLRLPPPQELPTLWRFVDLEPAATERLAAARARADLFERLWPELEPHHPASGPILQALLDRQADAALEPRPLWELTDFLKRPVVQRRMTVEPRFASEVDSVLVREVARRLELAPEPTSRELVDLLAFSGRRWSPSLLAVIRRVLASAPDAALRMAPPLMHRAMETESLELMEVVLCSLPVSERRSALEAAVLRVEAPAREPLLRLAEEAADRMDDIELLFVSGQLRGHSLEALQTITRRLVAQEAEFAPTRLAPLLAQADPPVRLSWALGRDTPARLAWFAAEEGARAAHESALTPKALVRQCASAPNGARLLLVFSQGLTHVEPMAQALTGVPGLALDLIILALREEGSRAERFCLVAAEFIPSEQLLAPRLLQTLSTTREREWTRSLIERLGPQWTHALCTGQMTPDALAPWLDLDSFRQWLRGASRGQLLAAVHGPGEESLWAGLVSALVAWLDSRGPQSNYWIQSFLEDLMRGVSAREFELACEPLARLLRHSSRLRLDDTFTQKLLSMVAQMHPASGWRIIEVLFPSLYDRASRDEKSFFGALAAFFSVKDEGKAKHMRQWLIEIYIACNWPPESLLRCLSGNTELLRRLASRAVRTRGGMDYLERLPSALKAAPELASRWRRPIEEVLADPRRPVDYE